MTYNIDLYFDDDGSRTASINDATITDIDLLGLHSDNLDVVEFVDCVISTDLDSLNIHKVYFENCKFTVSITPDINDQTYMQCIGICPNIHSYISAIDYVGCKFTNLPEVVVHPTLPSYIHASTDDLELIRNIKRLEHLTHITDSFDGTIHNTNITKLNLIVKDMAVTDLSYLRSLRYFSIHNRGHEMIPMPTLPPTLYKLESLGLVDTSGNRSVDTTASDKEK